LFPAPLAAGVPPLAIRYSCVEALWHLYTAGTVKPPALFVATALANNAVPADP
jgi:hypothetical protein